MAWGKSESPFGQVLNRVLDEKMEDGADGHMKPEPSRPPSPHRICSVWSGFKVVGPRPEMLIIGMDIKLATVLASTCLAEMRENQDKIMTFEVMVILG